MNASVSRAEIRGEHDSRHAAQAKILQKLRNYRMNDNLCYGKTSQNTDRNSIKEIIQAMLERGYLCQTKDKYALLKLTDTSEELLQGTDPFVIAYRKAEVQKTSARRGVKGLGDLSEKAQHLFEELRKLRSELAKEKSIPPYMVASDKTLHDMCVKIPLTKEEMLTANGMAPENWNSMGRRFYTAFVILRMEIRRHTEPRKRTMVLQRFR